MTGLNDVIKDLDHKLEQSDLENERLKKRIHNLEMSLAAISHEARFTLSNKGIKNENSSTN